MGDFIRCRFCDWTAAKDGADATLAFKALARHQASAHWRKRMQILRHANLSCTGFHAPSALRTRDASIREAR
jgi:hypothetical protein